MDGVYEIRWINQRNTRFKKGNKPKNYRPVGSERITKDGYIEVKVADPNKWETKNKIIYKQYFGDIPKGHKVIYADGNKLNNDINNLILVSDNEELIMNRHKLRSENIELTKTGCLIAKVIDKTNMVKNERLWATVLWFALWIQTSIKENWWFRATIGNINKV